jgi:uncharacterized LabA/DUF88 family protein
MMKRIGVYIDINNLYQALRHNRDNKQLDYEKLMDEIKDMGEIVDAIAYGCEFGNEAADFKCMLTRIGVTPKYKKLVPNRKFSWSPYMIVDIMDKLDSMDIIVLCTGDGDLTPLVTRVREAHGKKVIIIACSPSKSLRNHADSTIEIYGGLLCS